MFLMAVFVGAIAMALLGYIPVIGYILAGFLAGIIVKDAGGGALAGFLSGTIQGVIATVFFTAMDGVWGAVFGYPPGALPSVILRAASGGIIIIAMLYCGILGLVGGAIGGALKS